MSFKSIVRELREMKDGIGNVSRRRVDGKHWRSRTRAHIAPDVIVSELVQQGKWANLPPELLLDIIKRVEESEISWPARSVVVYCGLVCKSWRDITKEIVKTPEICGRLTFPISLKQPGPRDSPIQCFIKRDRATSTYLLYIGLTPSENKRAKLLLAAKKIRRATSTDFVISLLADDFSKTSNTYLGKLRQVLIDKVLGLCITFFDSYVLVENIRSNFLGTKFTIYDNQPPTDVVVQSNSSQRFGTNQVSPKLPPVKYTIATVSYELNVLRTRGPRRMQCIMHSVPIFSIQEGGTAPTPTTFPSSDEQRSLVTDGKEPAKGCDASTVSSSRSTMPSCEEPMVLKNKAPRWHEQLQCWCLNFNGRVTVASVKNFQLVAAVDSSHNVSVAEQEKVILQFGKIGKDIFSMDYRYPLSAFQAFAICLSSFDTKPACE